MSTDNSQEGNLKAAKLPGVSRSKALLFRILSVAIGLTVAVALAEVVLRVAGWSAPGFYVAGVGPIDLRGPRTGGSAFPPGTHVELRHYDYSVEWTVNRHGFRDREVTAKQPGEWRIGMVGDSFTAGIGVEQRDRFADLFGAGLTRNGKNVTVWNLGVPACGTACEADMLEYASKEYQLDEIVLAFFGGNDLEDNAAWSANAAGTPPQGDVSLQVKVWLRQRSRLATFLWVNAVRGWSSVRPTVIFDRTQLDKFWPDTERALQSALRAAGTKRLTLLYLPASPEWNDAFWETMVSRYGAHQQSRYVVRDALAEWSRREQVDFVDATDWLKGCRPQSECLYPVDPHWTARGHFIVAQGLLAEPKWSGLN